MSQRFIRCPHCSLPHDALQPTCPSSGKTPTGPRAAEAPFNVRASLPPRFAPIPALKKTVLRRDLVGTTVGRRYAILRVLGGGGTATVFEAEHLTMGRSVAVKVLHPEQAKKREAVQRFYREARAAGCIAHPNVCEVYDLDILDDGSPYLVMDRLVGATLARRIAEEQKLPLYDLMTILIQILSAIGAAHDRGIVHRDIKPENIFLSRRGGGQACAKLLDFGTSKTIGAPFGRKDDDVDLTRRGMVMGTPHYMSPEQARGDRDLDVRVDLYACGVILYEALTGHRPFGAATYGDLLREVLKGQPRPARELRPALPSGFDAILGKAMARNRDDRYRSAREFQRELQSLRDGYRYLPFGVGAAPSRSFPSVRRAIPVDRPQEARVEDMAPTRMMLRDLLPDSSDDRETIVRFRVPDAISRLGGGSPARGGPQAPLGLRTRKP